MGPCRAYSRLHKNTGAQPTRPGRAQPSPRSRSPHSPGGILPVWACGLSPASWPQRRPSSSTSQSDPICALWPGCCRASHHRHRCRLRASREPRRAGRAAQSPNPRRGPSLRPWPPRLLASSLPARISLAGVRSRPGMPANWPLILSKGNTKAGDARQIEWVSAGL